MPKRGFFPDRGRTDSGRGDAFRARGLRDVCLAAFDWFRGGGGTG